MPSDLPSLSDLPVFNEPSPINAARRAIVYCYVEWSGPELHSRAAILAAVEALRAKHPPVAFEFFAIGEDAPAFADWLMRYRHMNTATGAGQVFWLEAGQCVDYEPHAASALTRGLIQRTVKLWRIPR